MTSDVTSSEQAAGRVVLLYDLTEDERMATLSHLRRNQRLQMVWYVLIGLAFIGGTFTEIPDNPVALRLGLAAMGVSFVVAGLFLPRLWRDRMRKVFAQTPDAGLSRVTFDESGVRDETSVTEVLLRWQAFTHYTVRDRPEMLVLFRGRYQPVPVPRRACADEAQWQSLLGMAARHIGRTAPGGSAFPVIQQSGSRSSG